MVELAIDFEQAPDGKSQAAEARHADDVQAMGQGRQEWGANTKLIPAEPVSNSYALRSIGEERAMGYNRRPLFVSEQTVMSHEGVMSKRFKRDRLERIKNLVQAPNIGSLLPQRGDGHR